MVRGGGECEQRSEAFVKIKEKYIFIFFWGGQGGCERRSEALVKIQKKIGGGGFGPGGGRM